GDHSGRGRRDIRHRFEHIHGHLRQSAGATLIERKLMEWTAELLGFSAARADGIFTSGGTQSNLQALLIARNQAMSELGASLPDGLARLRIYTSADAHFSIANAAMLL